MGYKIDNVCAPGPPQSDRSRAARVTTALVVVALVAAVALACRSTTGVADDGPAQDPLATPAAPVTAALPATAAVGAATLQVQVQVPDRREVRAQCRAAGLVRQCAAAGVP